MIYIVNFFINHHISGDFYPKIVQPKCQIFLTMNPKKLKYNNIIEEFVKLWLVGYIQKVVIITIKF